MKWIRYSVFLFAFLPQILWAQSENSLIRNGNDKYTEGQFNEAEIDYRKSLEKNASSVKGTYNLANALYKQKNYEESNKLYGSVAQQDLSDNQKADAFYNLGNTFLEQKKFQESIDAYKNAVRLNPDDEDYRFNLE